jgi:sodium/proline symporter
MPDSGNTGLVIFGLYLLTVVGIGLWAARYQRTSEDFWVGGRRFGLGVMIVANMAAIMHGGSILSGIAFAGRFGGVASLPLAAFAAGFAVIFFFFAKKLRRSGGFTIPDYMGDRFNSNWLRGWSAVVVAVSSTVYLIAQIRGMAFILETLLEVPFLWGLVIGTLIFVAYVALGGLLAVVWTNIAQFVFMWLGLLILAPFVYREVGGWFSVIEQVEAIAPGWTSVSGVQWTGWYMMSWYMIWFVAYCTRLELVTKMFAARNDKIARYSLPWSILLTIVFLLYGVFYLGAAARILVWDQIASADQAFPVLVATILTPTLAAIALTGIASAAMSTTDSLLLLSGSAIAHDLLRKCFHEPRGIVRDERYYVGVSRLAIVAVGLLAFLCAIPDVALILRIVSFAIAIVGAAFFFPLLVGLTSKRVSTAAALSSSVGGVVVTVVWIVATLAGTGWAQALHPGVPGLITAGLLMGIVTMFTPQSPPHAVAKFFPEAG